MVAGKEELIGHTFPGVAGPQGVKQLEGSLKAVGETMASLQALWQQIAPNSLWCARVLSLPPCNGILRGE